MRLEILEAKVLHGFHCRPSQAGALPLDHDAQELDGVVVS